MGPVVHQLAEVAVVAARDQATLRDHQHPRPDLGDLVEHVARHQHAPTFVAEAVEQRDHVASLHRVEAGERLVEDQHLGIVDQRRRHLDPLAHPLGELTDRLGADVGEFDQSERVAGGALGVADPVGPGRELEELAGAEVVEQGVLLRHERHASADVAVGAWVRAEHVDRPARRWGRARTASGTASTCRRRSARAAP